MTTLQQVRRAYQAAGYSSHAEATTALAKHFQARECLMGLPPKLLAALRTQLEYTGEEQFEAWMNNLLLRSGTTLCCENPGACRTK